VSLVFERNPNVFLILSAGSPPGSEDYAFALEVEDCGGLFDQLRAKPFVTGGRILSEEVFEYPLGKNFLLRDPSGNRFLIFREDV
jgi:predicted enzyme related to lactoylglutathione lyase